MLCLYDINPALLGQPCFVDEVLPDVDFFIALTKLLLCKIRITMDMMMF